MIFIKTKGDVVKNCRYLFDLATSDKTSKARKNARDLISRGRCFLPVTFDGILGFFPSRYIGYIDNNIDLHLSNNVKHGNSTNRVLSKVFGCYPEVDDVAEKDYRNFCDNIGIQPRIAESARRRYWPSQEKAESNNTTHGLGLEKDLAQILADQTTSHTEKAQLIAARIGQGAFRKTLIEEWKACPLTKCSQLEALRASHIQPWSTSNNADRVAPENGILLLANIDALFDRFMLSFDASGKILISSHISEANRNILGLNPNWKIALKGRRATFMEHHRRLFREKEDSASQGFSSLRSVRIKT